MSNLINFIVNNWFDATFYILIGGYIEYKIGFIGKINNIVDRRRKEKIE